MSCCQVQLQAQFLKKHKSMEAIADSFKDRLILPTLILIDNSCIRLCFDFFEKSDMLPPRLFSICTPSISQRIYEVK